VIKFGRFTLILCDFDSLNCLRWGGVDIGWGYLLQTGWGSFYFPSLPPPTPRPTKQATIEASKTFNKFKTLSTLESLKLFYQKKIKQKFFLQNKTL